MPAGRVIIVCVMHSFIKWSVTIAYSILIFAFFYLSIVIGNGNFLHGWVSIVGVSLMSGPLFAFVCLVPIGIAFSIYLAWRRSLYWFLLGLPFFPFAFFFFILAVLKLSNY